MVSLLFIVIILLFTCRNAGLERNIRSGRLDDVAYLAPALIPVPGAFEGDRKSDALSSFVGQKIMEKVKDGLVRSDIGMH
jgi:hypothetical protein